MYRSIDTILNDWGVDKPFTQTIDANKTYTQEELLQRAYNIIQQNNSLVEPYVKRQLKEVLPNWLEKHAKKLPNNNYQITSAAQHHQ